MAVVHHSKPSNTSDAIYCVVPENIHTPPHGRDWKFRRGGGSKAQEFPERAGGVTQ